MYPNIQIALQELSEAEQAEGKLKSQFLENKLMKSVLENDQELIDDGKLIADALNQGISSFTPDLAFQQITQNYSVAKQIFGETLIRMLTGYDPGYIRKNINIPEFKKELYGSIKKRIEQLKEGGFVDKQGSISEKGVALASLILYTEELDHLIPKGITGEKFHKKTSHYGEKGDVRTYRTGDRYKDLALKKSLKRAVRRQHTALEEADLQTFERQSKGQIDIIYALDASGSMKGDKLAVCKKAGIALAYKAIANKDKVGLIVFGSEVKEHVAPTLDFIRLLKQITTITASRETDFVTMIEKSIELFPKTHSTKHLIILTDALPTVGKDPEGAALQAASRARAAGITISLVGIHLDKSTKAFAEKLALHGQGRLYLVKNLKELDVIVLEDYYAVA